MDYSKGRNSITELIEHAPEFDKPDQSTGMTRSCLRVALMTGLPTLSPVERQQPPSRPTGALQLGNAPKSAARATGRAHPSGSSREGQGVDPPAGRLNATERSVDLALRAAGKTHPH